MHYISSEALLEMYYLQATLNEIKSIYGHKSLRLIKPSPQEEKWVGFDQGWVSTTLSDKEFLDGIKKSIKSGVASSTYFAVFRQYKRVEKITKASDYLPYRHTAKEWSTPYYRVDLYTKPGKEGDFGKVVKVKVGPSYSQHEALVKLSALPNTDVHYACPMLFKPLDVWTPPNMNDVRLVSVKKTHPTFNDDDNHHLCFKNTADTSPEFHSDEIYTSESVNGDEWAQGFFLNKNNKLNANQLLTLLLKAGNIMNEVEPNFTQDLIENIDIENEGFDNQFSNIKLAKSQSITLSIFEITEK